MALILERHMSFPISSSRRVGCMYAARRESAGLGLVKK